jgi:UDP-glucose 4-epimerase
MHVVITGAAGFIGSHLVHYHLQKGDSVVAIDSLETGSRKNLEEVLDHQRLKHYFCPLQECSELESILSSSDRVYHMAALLGLKYVFSNPMRVISQNVIACQHLLETAGKIRKPLQILIASSSCVYGGTKSSLSEEEDSSLILTAKHYKQEAYTSSKITNEVMSLCSASNPFLHVVIARLFNVIGPRQTGCYGMVVPTLICQALKGEPMTVYGSGLQTRSFCSVHDIITACNALLQAPSSCGQIYNIGSCEEISILALAEKIKALTASVSPIIFIPYKLAYGFDYKEIMRRQPNIQKLTKETGFIPKYSLDETLLEIIDFFSKGFIKKAS